MVLSIAQHHPLDGIAQSMDVSFSKLQEKLKDRKPGMLQSMGSQRVRHDLGAEQQLYYVSKNKQLGPST